MALVVRLTPDAGSPLGWHFYCDRDETTEEENKETQAAPPMKPPSATERILSTRRTLEEARARAILEPSTENVTAYLRLQQEALQSAATFSDAFRRAVWANPALDYTLKRPVGALAKRLWSDERRAERDGALARLGERYGLIYLGSERCPACRVFGPLLRAFSLRHGIEVLAVSMTGGALAGWPEAAPDRGPRRAARHQGPGIARRRPLRHADRPGASGLIRRRRRGPVGRAHLRDYRKGGRK